MVQAEFLEPVAAGSKSSEVVRDAAQRHLLGEPKERDQWGTGMIPLDCIGKMSVKMGLANCLDGLLVKHVSGEWSSLGFKTYEQERQKWQGETLDLVWFDEEPKSELYIEGLTRTNATGGIVYITFTPILGMSEVVRMFLADNT